MEQSVPWMSITAERRLFLPSESMPAQTQTYSGDANYVSSLILTLYSFESCYTSIPIQIVEIQVQSCLARVYDNISNITSASTKAQ